MSTQKKTWHIAGMHCPRCETDLLRAVKDLDGLSLSRADYRAGTLTAQWDDKRLPEEKLAECIAQAGYELKRENSSALRRILTLLCLILALLPSACSLPSPLWRGCSALFQQPAQE